jgi:DNA-binding LacI/PurR family transcriptional regulator
VAPQDAAVAGFDKVRFSASKLISLTSVDQRAG